MDNQTVPHGVDDMPLDEVDGLEPEPEPLSPKEVEAFRHRRAVADEDNEISESERKAASKQKKTASSRLKTVQMEDEARRVERGEGAPSAAETARSIAGVIGGIANVVTSALHFIASNHVISAIFIGAVLVVVLFCTFGGKITDGIGNLGSGLANLWDTYITQPAERNANKTPTSINKVSLTNAVSIGRLNDATASYKGLATKTNDKGEAVCHIYYETTVTAYVDTSEVDFIINDEDKTVTPSLPDQQIEVDTPSIESIEYFEENPDIGSDEALSICDTDAKTDAADNQALITCGQENLKKTIEALIDPVLSGTEYKISW